mgnify:CR=1 FL=1
MKKLIGILVLGSFFMSSPANAGAIGRGDLTLGPTAVKSFIEYVQQRDQPRLFLVPTDGSSASWWYCPAGVNCVPGGATQEISKCERYHKKECAIFAKRRTIKWSNGINKGNKESRFKSKMTAAEIKAKLTSLGFLGGTTSTTTKVEKKKETKDTSSSSNLTEELKELNKLYKEGVLTKEEFEKAKKKLLN